MPQLSPGDQFPRLVLAGPAGPVELAARWADGPLVVAFMRHFGCAFCREHLIKLGRGLDQIRGLGAEVVAVFQYEAGATATFCRARGVAFDCLGDPDRAGYTAVGLGQGERREYLGAKVVKGWLRAARSGAVLGVPSGDIALRPGTFVVARGGTVALAHYNADSTDNVEVDELLAALRSLA